VVPTAITSDVASRGGRSRPRSGSSTDDSGRRVPVRSWSFPACWPCSSGAVRRARGRHASVRRRGDARGRAIRVFRRGDPCGRPARARLGKVAVPSSKASRSQSAVVVSRAHGVGWSDSSSSVRTARLRSTRAKPSRFHARLARPHARRLKSPRALHFDDAHAADADGSQRGSVAEDGHGDPERRAASQTGRARGHRDVAAVDRQRDRRRPGCRGTTGGPRTGAETGTFTRRILVVTRGCYQRCRGRCRADFGSDAVVRWARAGHRIVFPIHEGSAEGTEDEDNFGDPSPDENWPLCNRCFRAEARASARCLRCDPITPAAKAATANIHWARGRSWASSVARFFVAM